MRTHCQKGHELTPENTNPSGRCRTCLRANDLRHRRGETDQARGAIVCGRKFCSRCGRWRHIVDFSPVKKRSDGSHVPGSWCQACDRADCRRWYDETKADPERWALHLEKLRFDNHRRRRRSGAPERQFRTRRVEARTSRVAVLPAGPFLAWLDQWEADNPEESPALLAARAGFSERSLRRVRFDGQPTVSVGFIDGVLTAAGEAQLIHALYPVEGGAEIELPPPVVRRVRERHHQCGFGGCHEGDGHGAFGRFCPEHAIRLDAIREEFEHESRTGLLGTLADGRRRRWERDYGGSELPPEFEEEAA